MSKQYDNTNSGFLGKNDRKNKDSQPDITGSLNVEGREYWLNGWKNAKGYGLRIKPKDAPAERPKETAAEAAAKDFSDDLPF